MDPENIIEELKAMIKSKNIYITSLVEENNSLKKQNEKLNEWILALLDYSK